MILTVLLLLRDVCNFVVLVGLGLILVLVHRGFLKSPRDRFKSWLVAIFPVSKSHVDNQSVTIDPYPSSSIGACSNFVIVVVRRILVSVHRGYALQVPPSDFCLVCGLLLFQIGDFLVLVALSLSVPDGMDCPCNYYRSS
jgi:hypothetical protein